VKHNTRNQIEKQRLGRKRIKKESNLGRRGALIQIIKKRHEYKSKNDLSKRPRQEKSGGKSVSVSLDKVTASICLHSLGGGSRLEKSKTQMGYYHPQDEDREIMEKKKRTPVYANSIKMEKRD